MPIEIVSVKLAHTLCEIAFNSETSLICNLVTPWVVGNWLPAVRDANGLVPIQYTVPVHEVPLILTSFTPENINPVGGDIIIVVGKNFPSNLDDFPAFNLVWEDGTPCNILTSSAAEVTCQIGEFS